MLPKHFRQTIIIFLLAFFLVGCGSNPGPTSISEPTSIPQASAIPPTPTAPEPSPVFDLSKFAFPASIDPTKHYLFYLHGKIIEDQGIPAVSPDFGEYEYAAILERLSSYGFAVVSEQRAINTDVTVYANSVSDQVTALLDSGVPAQHVTLVGASKGGAITILVSYLLKNPELNFVILAICNPETVNGFVQDQVSLYGNVLSIYDSSDDLAGSCQDLFSYSEGRGLSKHNEIVLHIGTGHGILYKPLDEWVIPTVQWAENP